MCIQKKENMKRLLIEKLKEWKNSASRQPLILRGARQVGKTWLMKEFAETEYRDYIYVNFEFDEDMKTLFDADLNPERILFHLKIFSGIEAKPGTTLIIFDEIQEARRGLTSLKYFSENAPEYHVITAGSLLGITLHQHISFPVGKVDFLDLYPRTPSGFFYFFNNLIFNSFRHILSHFLSRILQ